MPLSRDAGRRQQLLESVGHALATLRSAVSTIDVGEPIAGCAWPVRSAREIGGGQIDLVRAYLDELEPLVKGADRHPVDPE